VSERLAVDTMAGGAAVEVRLIDGFRVGEGPIRAPHRHDYHELMWVREGEGEQLIDGEPLAIEPGTVTVIARGQVHQFRHATGLGGALVRITDVALAGEGAGRIPAGWLLGGRGGRTIAVPPGERDRFEAVLRALHAETRRPPIPTAPTSSATSPRRSCSGSSAGTRHRAPSARRPRTPTSSCTGASPSCSSATSPATTTSPTTPTRCASRPRRSRAR
jgi:mannose-6-phosphate isomerase-like protein (cupin superfamily)